MLACFLIDLVVNNLLLINVSLSHRGSTQFLSKLNPLLLDNVTGFVQGYQLDSHLYHV